MKLPKLFCEKIKRQKADQYSRFIQDFMLLLNKQPAHIQVMFYLSWERLMPSIIEEWKNDCNRKNNSTNDKRLANSSTE